MKTKQKQTRRSRQQIGGYQKGRGVEGGPNETGKRAALRDYGNQIFGGEHDGVLTDVDLRYTPETYDCYNQCDLDKNYVKRIKEKDHM